MHIENLNFTTQRMEESTSARALMRSHTSKRKSCSTEISKGETAFKIFVVLSVPRMGTTFCTTCRVSAGDSARQS